MTARIIDLPKHMYTVLPEYNKVTTTPPGRIVVVVTLAAVVFSALSFAFLG